MDKTERLFAVMDALRRYRRPVTAQQLADEQAVSVRTLYRDIQTLIGLGAPIDGEAGIGYMLRPGFFLPPLMFTPDELEALVVGTRFVRAFGGNRLGREAAAALLKIEAVLPPELRERSDRTRIFAPEVDRLENSGLIDDLHAAVTSALVLRMNYRDNDSRTTAREIEPLCLAFWGGSWTLGAWCRLRGDFRNFRPDRIVDYAPTGETFVETRERGLAAYMTAVQG